MKLFIVNKEEFDNDFQSRESQKAIHKRAFNYLMQSIGYDDSIPNMIEFDFEMFNVNFEFTNQVGDVYFFLYSRK
jgi:hypothetical protein